MTFKEFLRKNRISKNEVCRALGITRMTVYKMCAGVPVSKEMAFLVKSFVGQGVEVPTLDGKRSGWKRKTDQRKRQDQEIKAI